jgi:hypothetical protein
LRRPNSGLFLVQDAWRERGRRDFFVCRYRARCALTRPLVM